jgi:hypothetical protein
MLRLGLAQVIVQRADANLGQIAERCSAGQPGRLSLRGCGEIERESKAKSKAADRSVRPT